MPYLLQRVCLELGRIMHQQADTGSYWTSQELDKLFQLHTLLTATWQGTLTWDEWSKAPYVGLLTTLRQPTREGSAPTQKPPVH